MAKKTASKRKPNAAFMKPVMPSDRLIELKLNLELKRLREMNGRDFYLIEVVHGELLNS